MENNKKWIIGKTKQIFLNKKTKENVWKIENLCITERKRTISRTRIQLPSHKFFFQKKVFSLLYSQDYLFLPSILLMVCISNQQVIYLSLRRMYASNYLYQISGIYIHPPAPPPRFVSQSQS